MFTVEIAKNRKYAVAETFESADEAIYHFLDLVDAHDTIRLVGEFDGVLARKTPSGNYIAKSWR